MNLTECLTFLAIIISFSIICIKIYNITKLGKWYNPIWTFVSFAGYLFTWLITLITFLLNVSEDVIVIYQIVFVITSFLLVVCIALTIIEFLLAFSSMGDTFKIK